MERKSYLVQFEKAGALYLYTSVISTMLQAGDVVVVTDGRFGRTVPFTLGAVVGEDTGSKSRLNPNALIVAKVDLSIAERAVKHTEDFVALEEEIRKERLRLIDEYAGRGDIVIFGADHPLMQKRQVLLKAAPVVQY